MECGAYVAVAGYAGIAFTYVGPETVADEDTYWTGERSETGMAVVVMVGDDRRHTVDPDDLTAIDRDAFCGQCGQMGCAHDGRAEV